ncbi:unnamed protein product [Orchesella dallaii]|uniref:Uncharacterized protein n=1 Tax=Orchesella dallaii TaxID=48710 RepID=A0ABP1R6P3_9HEXA
MNILLHIIIGLAFPFAAHPAAFMLPDTFRKYWSTGFKMFTKDCTINFEHIPTTWNALHLSFHSMCSSASISSYCVSLISWHNKSWETTLAADNLSPMYYRVFSCQKLQRICVVQLPVVLQPLSPQEIYFTSIDNRGEGFSNKFDEKQYVPDYVLIPLSSQLTSIPVAKFLSSKLIALIENGNSQTVFIGCLTCLPKTTADDGMYFKIEGYYYNIVNASLNWIQNENISLQTIDAVWLTLHKDLQNLGHRRQVHLRHNQREYSQPKQFFTCCNKDKKYIEQGKCVLKILQEFHNCSHFMCTTTLFNSISYGSPNLQQAIKHAKLNFFSSGAQFHGAKYVLFTPFTMQGFSNIEALLSPLNFQVWILSLLSFLCLCGLFKAIEPQIITWFWLLSALLEKSVDLKATRKLKMRLLFIIWMLSTYLLRNFYTSTVYSHLTKQAEPADIPKSYEGLLISTEFNIISDVCISRHLQNCKRSDFYEGKQDLEEFWIRFCDKYLPKRMQVLRLIDSYSPYGWLGRLASNLPTSCRNHYGRETIECDHVNYWKRFGLVYYTNVDELGCGTLLPLLVPLFGRRMAIQINEPAMIFEPFLWSISLRTYFSSFLFKKSLASLVESGIWMYYKQFKDILNLAQKIRKTSEVQGHSRNRGFYSFAATIHHSKGVPNSGKIGNSTVVGNRFEGTTVKQLGVLWILYSGLVSVSVLSMVIENCYNCVYSGRN